MTAVAMALPEEGERRDSVITNSRLEAMSEPRVLFFAGDSIKSNEKHFNPDWKGWGGVYLPHVYGIRQSANKGMLYKCQFFRLVPVMIGHPSAMLHPQDRANWSREFSQEKFNPATGQIDTVTIKGFKGVKMSTEEDPHERTATPVNSPHIVYKKRYPEEDVNLATKVAEPNGVRGVVEITALRNSSPAEVKDAQMFFFPNWKEIQKGNGTLPEKIADLERHIQSRINAISSIELALQNKYRMIGQDMLKSCTEFRLGGEMYLKFVEDQMNAAKAGGYTLTYPEYAIMLGEQLGIRRKDDLVAGDSSAVDRLAKSMESRDTTDRELRERELAVRERELALREAELGLSVKRIEIPNEPITMPSTIEGQGVSFSVSVPEDVTPINVTDGQTDAPYTDNPVVVRMCGKPTANGECKRELKEGEVACWQHLD